MTRIPLPFDFDGDRQGEGGTLARSRCGTAFSMGIERALGVRVTSEKPVLGEGIELVDKGFRELEGVDTSGWEVLA